jgi:hypothetical protein
MKFSREHLLNEYSWPEGAGAGLYNGEPSRRLFDRNNGEQVLFILNAYAAVTNQCTIGDAHHMEMLISRHLPPGLKSEISVFQWLRETLQNEPA